MLRMPDGTPLAALLSSWESREAALFGGVTQKKTRSRGRKASAAEHKWDAAPRVAAKADHDDDEALEREHTARTLSGRRRRRYLSDCFLRELAGPLLAEDIAMLYAPVPFGVQRETCFEQLAQQPRLAQEFMACVDAPLEETAASTSDTGAICQAWARVGRRGRVALRRGVAGALFTVQQTEAALSAFLASSETTLELEGLDSYTRLLVHALCSWSGKLASSSHTAPDGARSTLVRRRADGRDDGTALPQCSSFLLGFAEA
jgi:hypothetical protein